MIAKVSGLAKVGLSVAAGLLGLTVLMTLLAAAGSEATREGESPAGYRELLGASSVATVTATAYPTSIRVGGYTSTITATLLNELGELATDEDGINVSFFTNLGVLGSDMVTKTTKTGVVTAELTSETLGGIADILATADSKSDWTQVVFSYGTPTTVTVGVYPTSILADGVSTSTITATVQDELGYLIVDGTVVTFTTDYGTLGSSWVTKTTTTGVATAVLTSDTTARLSCWVKGWCGDEFGLAYIEFSPGLPYTVTVVANPNSIPIGGYASTIEATVVDRYGNRVDPVTVAFTTSLGTIFPLTGTTSNGEASTTLTSTSTLGTATVTATASSKVGDALVTFVTRIFVPLVMKSYTP